MKLEDEARYVLLPAILGAAAAPAVQAHSFLTLIPHFSPSNG